jgi:hypothetical protein
VVATGQRHKKKAIYGGQIIDSNVENHSREANVHRKNRNKLEQAGYTKKFTETFNTFTECFHTFTETIPHWIGKINSFVGYLE